MSNQPALIEHQPTPMVQHATTPMSLLEKAMTMEGVAIEKLEALFALQVKYEENEARKAFHAAMAEFNKEQLTITKDQHVNYSTSKGKTDYRHASLGNIVDVVAPALGRVGISASWSQVQDNNTLTVTCTLTHKLGHSESVSMSAPFDSSGGKNFIQAIGSANTYLQRYTFMAVTGQAAQEMDDDGNSAYESRQEECRQTKKQKQQKPQPTMLEWFLKSVDAFMPSGKAGEKSRTPEELDEFITKHAKERKTLNEKDEATLAFAGKAGSPGTR